MSTSQVLLGNAGTPQTIEHAGKTYAVGKLDRNAQDAFSVWLADRRRERIVMQRGSDEAGKAADLAEHREDFLSGVFDFFEPLVMGRPVRVAETRVIDGKEVQGFRVEPGRGALQTTAGKVALVAILCGLGTSEAAMGEAMALMVAKPAEANHLLEVALSQSMPGVKGEADNWKPAGPDGPNAGAG